MTTTENPSQVHILMIRDTECIVGAVIGTNEKAEEVAEIMNRGRYADMVVVKTTDLLRFD